MTLPIENLSPGALEILAIDRKDAIDEALSLGLDTRTITFLEARQSTLTTATLLRLNAAVTNMQALIERLDPEKEGSDAP